MHKPIRVAVVEDDARTLSRLCGAIVREPGFVLAESFSCGLPAIAWLRHHPVDILLTDLGLPDTSGIEVIRACVEHQAQCDIMVITMFGDEKNVLTSIESGAMGYILKGIDEMDVGRAMRDLRAGGSPMTPLIARKVLTRARRSDPSAAAQDGGTQAPAVALTNREAEILNLIARGYTYEEVSKLLSVSLSTVQTHIKNTYGKLAVKSRAEAVYEANRMGLLRSRAF
ncbi:response regulator transcription factor [Noviherbaspirillum sp.]|uniref:response regulator transcription factor n=1 Tax=Noviherbaspirillum sp. TaxID=1926288 RepID=UPI002D2A4CA5|nr:response regulator transcription factor [Noviherbaspirillum sp.]HZW23054.1 response regulator transcription factor [Noviherbaspirillum sp.]